MLTCAAVLLGTAAVGIANDYGSARQYYTPWQKPANSQYAYRTYYYKPTPTYAGYKHHYVIQKGDHCYFYNPYEKKYWGRCPSQSYGRPQYSHLPPEWRRPTLQEIPESAFPTPGNLPPIPESDGSVVLDLPPDDLPSEIFLSP
ncbi:MAG: hypothetical protein R3B90_19270 [Planctomycetaceae bacterium]